jgi:hypothetical protein
MGLGDHLVCNGMVRYLVEAENPDFLFLPVKKHNYFTVRSMYIDDPRIICLPCIGDSEVPYMSQAHHSKKLFRAGFEKTTKEWDISFYDSVGVPFSARWSHFKVNRNLERENSLEERLNTKDNQYIVVHDASSVGVFDKMSYDSKGMRVIKVEPLTNSLLDWCGIIENAEEFHGIDSSVVHLAQSLNVKCGFVHASTPTPPQVNLNGNWSLIRY